MSRSPFASFQWHSDIFACDSTDIEHFYAQLQQEVDRLQLGRKKLGEIGDYPLELYQSPSATAELPSVLISAGFHGEEAAGPWGMLHFLSELQQDIFERINLSLLPLVNPTGFAKGHRFNKFGENPNRGFLQPKEGEASSPSVEGKLLLEYGQLLQGASREGILTCHEDVLQQQTYIYSFEPRQSPGQFSLQLRDTLGCFFDIAADGDIDGCPVQDGVIFNHFDTSFEAWLVRTGAKVGVCSETPATQNLDQRILANSAVMHAFVQQQLAPIKG
ncbi:M14 family metallocarboxypeptidase [Shewanella sp.]|uniref:N-acetyl-ornithine deacetylase n=1 Tax=Shewanella sp. TaxID=50422 RepID=UPI000EED95A7|nr:M14 family metallocarboxypeptidase [Shewanella sp.]HCD13251.1 N-acetyl-L-ornithine deacetylase ArgE [Shewanella sp.]